MNPESRRDLLCLLESVFVGLFFVQAVRFLYGTLYAQVSSASLVNVTANREALQGQLGVVSAANVELSLAILGVALVAPLLSIVLGRLWFGVTLAAGVVAAGRVFLTANGGTTAGILGASLVVGGGMLYLTIIAGRRPGMFPVGLVGGFALDHLIRLYGNTRDLTMTAEFLNFQTILSVALFLVAVGAALLDQFGLPPTRRRVRGAISLWGAFALGGLLYLEFAVLGLANTAAHRVGLDYNALAPWLVGATLLPLVGEVRAFVRSFLNMFDTRYRGWVWFLLIALLIVIGMRLGGFPGGAALVIAQFMVCLSFWWIATPTDAQRTISGISLMFGSLVLLLLSGADFFTFEYAFVRGVQEPFASILRGFRGLGLVII
ncbi:MAG TPA: hypothetical protein PLD47_06745, partial [Aggregatilineales bacterium]|nr:hypothetical protein [Aggregatilineales bacterium]